MKVQEKLAKLTVPQAGALGIIVGLFTSYVPGLFFGPNQVFVGFVLYSPFHAWLTLNLFLVCFSRQQRERILEPNLGFLGAFFTLLLLRRFEAL